MHPIFYTMHYCSWFFRTDEGGSRIKIKKDIANLVKWVGTLQNARRETYSKANERFQTAVCIVLQRSKFVPFYSSFFVCASMLKGDDGATKGTAVAAGQVQWTRNAIFAIYLAQTTLTDDRHVQMPINVEQNNTPLFVERRLPSINRWRYTLDE